MKFQKKTSRELDLESKIIVLQNEVDGMLNGMHADSLSSYALRAALAGNYQDEDFLSAPVYEQARYKGVAEALRRTEKSLKALSKPRF